jgi:hypothetical protein
LDEEFGDRELAFDFEHTPMDAKKFAKTLKRGKREKIKRLSNTKFPMGEPGDI